MSLVALLNAFDNTDSFEPESDCNEREIRYRASRESERGRRTKTKKKKKKKTKKKRSECKKGNQFVVGTYNTA